MNKTLIKNVTIFCLDYCFNVELQYGCFKFKFVVRCFSILEVLWEEKKMACQCCSTKNKHRIFVWKFKENERIRNFH